MAAPYTVKIIKHGIGKEWARKHCTCRECRCIFDVIPVDFADSVIKETKGGYACPDCGSKNVTEVGIE